MTVLRIFEDPHFIDEAAVVPNADPAELHRHKMLRKKMQRAIAFELGDKNALLIGGTRKGKSVAEELMCRGLIRNGAEGFSLIDPHGTVARPFLESLAHPASGQHARAVHVMDPKSGHTIGLNALRPHDNTWEAAHEAASVLASVIESRFEASAEQTPRLARIIYVAGMLCARHGLTLLELVELLSLGGEELRRSLLQDFDNRIVRRELEDLCTLASKSPREFLNIVESTKNRLVRMLGDPRLARILGQKRGLDLRAVFDNRDIVVADLSGLNYGDAALVGCIYSSMAFAVARRRPAMACARHRLILDEAESLITVDIARACDQTSKWGLNIVAAVQRLGQLRARGDFIFDSLLTNCAVKIIMGGLEFESARYMAENIFAGHVPLAEDKPGSERPAAVGQMKVTLQNRTRSEQQSDSQSVSDTSMRSWGWGAARSAARMRSRGTAIGSSDSMGFVTMPADHPIGTPPVVSKTDGFGGSRAASSSSATAQATSSSRQYAETRGHSKARSTTYGSTISEGESEALATVYEWLPAQYTLEEQLHRLTAELMTLPRREAFVRIDHEAPFRARTVDRIPAFKSAELKAELLPRYLLNAARRSPYAVPNSDVDREFACRFQAPPTSEATSEEFSPEPDPAAVAARAQALKRALTEAHEGEPPRPRLRIVKGKDGDSAS